MSYILDALKRAEAERERERGGVPTLTTHAGRSIDAAEDEVPVVPPLQAGRLVGIGLLAAGVIAAAAWWLWPRPSDPEADLAARTAASRLTSPAVLPITSDAPAVPAEQPPTPVGQATPAAPVNQVPAGGASPSVPLAMDPVGVSGAPVQQPPVPAARTAQRDAPRSSERAVERAQDRPQDRPGERTAQRPSPPALPPAVAPLPSAKAPAGAGSAPPRVSAMPAEWRKQLPALTVSGSLYSPDAPARMLILNGQILREGQNAGADLLVERIGPKAAVLSFRGQRFELPYAP